jgi:hypothetical protein
VSVAPPLFDRETWCTGARQPDLGLIELAAG